MTSARRVLHGRYALLLAGKASPAAIKRVAGVVFDNRSRCGAFARSTCRPCEAHVWVRADGTFAKRCRNHGGASTGPRTPEGKQRAALARELGYWRWRERKREAEARYWYNVGRRLDAKKARKGRPRILAE